MYRYGCLSVLLLLITFSPHSQQDTGGQTGYKKWYQRAEQWYTSANPTEKTDSLAYVSYQRVIELLKKENVINDILLDSYLKMGILQMTSNENEEALVNLKNAMQAWQKSNYLPDSLLFQPYLYAGSIQYSHNNLDSAVYYYKKAEDISSHYTVLNDVQRLYNKLGALYYETGDYSKSIRYFEKAVSVESEKKPVNNNFIVNYKNNIATALLKMGDYQQALDKYKELLQYHLNEDELYTNIGIASMEKGNPEEGLVYLRQVNQNSPLKYNNLTRAFLKTRQYDSAYYYNEKALKYFTQKKETAKNTDYGLALKYAGDLKTLNDNIAAGISNYQSAMIQIVPGFNDTTIVKNPAVFSGLQNFSFLFDILTAKGTAFKMLHAQQPNSLDLHYAVDAYSAALNLARHIERTYSSDDARLFLKDKVNPACSEAIALALQLYKQLKDPQYISAAFNYAENNKASVLQAGLHQLELSGIAGLPADLVAAEKKYKTLIAKLGIQAAQIKDSVSLTMAQKKLQETELLLSAVQEKLDENPAYHRLKFDTKAISPDSIMQKMLKKDEAVLSYYYTGDQLICFYLTKEQLNFSSIPLPNHFFIAIAALRKELASTGGSDRKFIDELSQQLYQSLLMPVIEKIKDKRQLIIIPYNEICYVPFELLKDKGNGSILLNKFAVTYNYSANFLFDDEENSKQAYRVLAMAPFAGNAAADAILPFLGSSAAEITGLPGNIISDTNATKARFVALAGNYPVIHLATHAVANDKDPLGSYIEFYGVKKDADADHRLYEKEIYNLDMKSANLLILSACETGNGLLVNGEGVVSLSRAFSYAGCKSVITSLWKADDVATAFIMRKLHVYLQKGLSKDIALQQAKIDYLNSSETEDRYKAPSYWAHLVLIGNHQPVVNAKSQWYIPIAIIILLSIIVILYVKKRNRAQ